MSEQKMRDVAEALVAIVMQQCSGYTSGPGFDAAQAARQLREALTSQAAQGEAVMYAIPGFERALPLKEPDGWYTEPLYAAPPAPTVPTVPDGWIGHGESALANISNALEDLYSSPDQRPVPLLKEAMHHIQSMLDAVPEVPRG